MNGGGSTCCVRAAAAPRRAPARRHGAARGAGRGSLGERGKEVGVGELISFVPRIKNVPLLFEPRRYLQCDK